MPKRSKQPKPIKIKTDLSFEEAMKLAADTPISQKKGEKRKSMSKPKTK